MKTTDRLVGTVYHSHLSGPMGKILGFNSALVSPRDGILNQIVRASSNMDIAKELMQAGTIVGAARNLVESYLNSHAYLHHEHELPVFNVEPNAFFSMIQRGEIHEDFKPMFWMRGNEVIGNTQMYSHFDISANHIEYLVDAAQNILKNPPKVISYYDN